MSALSDDIAKLPPQHSIVIETNRLRLRPVRPSDLADVHSIRRDPIVMTHMSTGPDPEVVPEKSDSVRRIRIMMQPNHLSFAVEIRGGQSSDASESIGDPRKSTTSAAETIGFVGCHRVPELFYNFKVAYWGSGYATEALRAYLQCYWKEFPQGIPTMTDEMKNCLEANVFEGNKGSHRVLEKAGFSFISRGMTERTGTPTAYRLYRICRPASEAKVAPVESQGGLKGS